jgi:hypothetical protein
MKIFCISPYLLQQGLHLLCFILQVANYVVEKLVLERPLDGGSDGTFSMGLTSGQSQLTALDSSSCLGLKPWQKLKPSVEILCNNQASSANRFYSIFRCINLLTLGTE